MFRAPRYPCALLLLSALCHRAADAQSTTVIAGAGFQPGSKVLYASDFSRTPVGKFPSDLKFLRGDIEIASVDGVPMLKSSSPSEFIIPLSAALPNDFTLEFDLVARNSNCCSGEELAFEGSPNLNRSAGSAWIAWHHQYTGIIGGGQTLGTSTVTFPEDLQLELIGQRALIQVMMNGTDFKLFTNGRRIYSLAGLVFRRTTVLRVLLGGVNDGAGAVSLARVTLATGGGGPVASSTPAPSGGVTPPGGGATPPGGGATPPGGGATPPGGSPTAAIAGFTVAARLPWGVNLSWSDLEGTDLFDIEMSENGQAFTVADQKVGQERQTNKQSQGVIRTQQVRLHPGTSYRFRITARKPDGSVLAVSTIESLVAPPQFPAVANIAATVGPLEQLPVEGVVKPARKVTWTWDPVPGATPHMATFDRIAVDPATGKSTTVRVPINPIGFEPGNSQAIEADATIHFCVAALNDPFASARPGQLAGGSCRDAPVPGGTLAATPPPTPQQTPAVTPPRSGAPVAGPAQITAGFAAEMVGWGMAVGWSVVANATSYRVYRVDSPSAPGLLLTTVTAAQATSTMLGAGDLLAVLDPDIYLGNNYTYWVEAVFADGSVSAPSSSAAGSARSTSSSFWTPPSVPSIKVSASEAKTITLEGGGQGYGKELTWSWDPVPLQSPYKAYLYYITIQAVTGSFSRPLIKADTVRTADPAPIYTITTATKPGPPYKMAVGGGTFLFCVSQVPIAPYLVANQPLGNWVSCLETVVK